MIKVSGFQNQGHFWPTSPTTTWFSNEVKVFLYKSEGHEFESREHFQMR